jgi:hypothetical protein
MEEIQWIDHCSSRVNKSVTRWIAGAAKNTNGAISAHEASHDTSQFITNAPSATKRKLATAEATEVVTPD